MYRNKKENINSQRNKQVKMKTKEDSSKKTQSRKDGKNNAIEARRKTSRHQPSTKWQNLRLFDEDQVER
jgi:hypothetical protein